MSIHNLRPLEDIKSRNINHLVAKTVQIRTYFIISMN